METIHTLDTVGLNSPGTSKLLLKSTQKINLAMNRTTLLTFKVASARPVKTFSEIQSLCLVVIKADKFMSSKQPQKFTSKKLQATG